MTERMYRLMSLRFSNVFWFGICARKTISVSIINVQTRWWSTLVAKFWWACCRTCVLLCQLCVCCFNAEADLKSRKESNLSIVCFLCEMCVRCIPLHFSHLIFLSICVFRSFFLWFMISNNVSYFRFLELITQSQITQSQIFRADYTISDF